MRKWSGNDSLRTDDFKRIVTKTNGLRFAAAFAAIASAENSGHGWPLQFKVGLIPFPLFVCPRYTRRTPTELVDLKQNNDCAMAAMDSISTE